MAKKLSYRFVKRAIQKEGYILLSIDYKNAHQKLRYVCPKGHQHYISWNNWKKGSRCPYCKGVGKPNIEFIKSEFEKDGYKLLAQVYNGEHHKLNYICDKGHKHGVSWSNWKKGDRCPYCAGNSSPTIEFIKLEFKKEKYKLLSTKYKNSNQKLDYICPKGHKRSINWNAWQQGQRCPKCRRKEFSIKYSGKNNHMYGKCGSLSHAWKGGISYEPYCVIWLDKDFKESIRQRDCYRCQNPDCWGKCNHLPLTIHHIDYNKKNCDPENLITLCRSCNSRANKNRIQHEILYKAIISENLLKKQI